MIVSQSGAVTTAKIDYSGGNKHSLLFVTSDLHIDSIGCNRDIMLEDFEEARKRDAKILLLGDIFDAMQGRFDPRRSLDELRPEYRRSDYYDYVIKDVVKILKPYAGNILLIAPGNHETAVLKNASISLIDRLVYSLNMENGTQIMQGGYGGWARFMFHFGTNGKRTSVKIKYHHGFGGDAPVTRGVIHTNRQGTALRNPDIVVNGHNHHMYYVPVVSEALTDSGKIIFPITHYIRTPGYKQDYGDGSNGWAVEKGMVPKPLGGAFISMEIITGGKVSNVRCKISVHPAVHEPEV